MTQPTRGILLTALPLLLLGTPSLLPAAPAEQHLLYVTVPDGAGGSKGRGIYIFDIENGHKLVRQIDIPDIGGTRGVCASPVTARLYYAHGNTRLACLDLLTDKKLWENNYPKEEGGADRIQITPDGKKLYVPSGWWSNEAHNKVVDAATGRLITKIKIADDGGCHNTIVSLDGRRVYCGSVKYNWLTVVDTATDTILRRVGPYTGVIWPHTVNGRQTLSFVNTGGLVGFEIGDLQTGKKLHTVLVEGMEQQKRRCHGIGLTPDETEVWLVDQDQKRLYVFDATVMPPKQKQHVDVSEKTHGWITFSMDGRFAYPDTGDVIDPKTKKIIATLKDPNGQRVMSSKFIEIHFRDGRPIRVGTQMGLGRVTGPATGDK
jgi:DNA-binding beta-propeller fold protein YncE